MRRLAITSALATVAGLGVGIAEPGPGSAAIGDPELGPLISGTSSYVDGTFVWTDYAYDDRGANSNGVAGGDATYPPNPYPGNTADLVQVQLGTGVGGALRVAVVLGTLVDGADVDIGVGFDTDSDPSTGTQAVPGGLWTVPAPVGLDEMVVLPTGGGSGSLLSWDEGAAAWERSGDSSVEVDRDRNVVGADVGDLQPGASTWRAVALAGFADGEGSWVDGAHPIFDLAFVRAEDPPMEPVVAITYSVPQVRSPHQDEIQADVLAGKPLGGTAPVTFGTKTTELAQPASPLNTFLYHSRVELGEGIRQQPLQYRGVYQPYVALIPPGLGARPPAIVFMHGANQNHLINAVHFSPSGLVISGSYHVPAVVLFPHGRDPSWDTGPAEQDLLDATDDAIARLGLDADRIVLSGISAGGVGTYRHGARYPDRWTGAYSIVGAGTTEIENLTNVPFRAHNGALDPLVNAGLWAASTNALATAGTVDYRSVLVNTQSHVPVPMGNCWYLDLISRPREVNPARVRYTLPPPAEVDADTVLQPNRAYWVSGLEARGSQPASIDASSTARVGRQAAGDITRVGENLTQGADFCGPNPAVRTGDNWTERGRAFEPTSAPTSNAMDLTVSGLSDATLDVARMAISTDEPVTARISGDGPTTLVLLGPWNGRVTVLRDGQVMGEQTATDRVVLDGDLSGTHTYEIRPRSASTSP